MAKRIPGSKKDKKRKDGKQKGLTFSKLTIEEIFEYYKDYITYYDKLLIKHLQSEYLTEDERLELGSYPGFPKPEPGSTITLYRAASLTELAHRRIFLDNHKLNACDGDIQESFCMFFEYHLTRRKLRHFERVYIGMTSGINHIKHIMDTHNTLFTFEIPTEYIIVDIRAWYKQNQWWLGELFNKDVPAEHEYLVSIDTKPTYAYSNCLMSLRRPDFFIHPLVKKAIGKSYYEDLCYKINTENIHHNIEEYKRKIMEAA